MIDYDLHIHTAYCGHAAPMTVETILRQVEALGLSTIAITDHIFAHEDHAVIQTIRDDVARVATGLEVFVGAEVDVDYSHTDGRLVTDNLTGLDYVIAGFHYVPTVGNYPRGPEDNALPAEEFMEHWASSLLGVVSNPAIDTLAHPGRLLASAVDLDVFFDDAMKVFEEAAALSANSNIAWEMNELTGCRVAAQWHGQWHHIYEIALDAGVKLIYGSDAHDPDTIGTHRFVDSLLSKLPKGCLARPEEVMKI